MQGASRRVHDARPQTRPRDLFPNHHHRKPMVLHYVVYHLLVYTFTAISCFYFAAHSELEYIVLYRGVRHERVMVHIHESDSRNESMSYRSAFVLP